VAQGFADRLIEPVRIAARFDIGRFRNAPPVLVEQVEAEPEPGDDTDGTNTEATDDVADGDQVDAEDEQTAAPMPRSRRRNAAAKRRAARSRRDPVGGPRACPRRRRSLPPRGPAADGRPVPRAGRQPRRCPRGAPRRQGRGEPEIAPHHPQPGRSSAARPWGEIVARTFKLERMTP
jgi:ATP-dependent Clp protease protease subunit